MSDLTVDLTSAARKKAEDHGLADADFGGLEPSGATGYTVADVDGVIEAKGEPAYDQEAQERIDRVKGYRKASWAGGVKYDCVHCSFCHSDEGLLQEHVRTRHT